MRWVISREQNIFGDAEAKSRRKDFIQKVTNSKVSRWNKYERRYLSCYSSDGFDAILLTTHGGSEMEFLCSQPKVHRRDYIFANCCMGTLENVEQLLKILHENNSNAQLFFCRQEFTVLEVDYKKTTMLNYCGNFGFPISESEMNLFRFRNRGFQKEIMKAFAPVEKIVEVLQ